MKFPLPVSFIVTTALVLVEANQEQELTASILWLGLAYMAMLTGAHLAVRKWAPYADPVLLPCVALLNGILRHLIECGYADRAFVDRHTVGFTHPADTVKDTTIVFTPAPRPH